MDSIKIRIGMAMAFILKLMEISMMGTGIIIKEMEQENCIMLMGTIMKEIGLMIRLMDMDCIYIVTGIDM